MNQSKAFFNLNINTLYNMFNSGPQGLKKKEVSSNQKKYGKNQLAEVKSKSKARVFIEQFQDILVVILIIAAIISIFTGGLESTIVIFSVITLNAFLGTVQYFKAEKSLQSLKKLASPVAKAIRDGKEIKIPSADVVVGDIILLNYGDVVPADIRIINCNNFEVNESSLTGESLAVEKNSDIILSDYIAIADMKNMAFSGTQVVKGKARGIVVGVGGNTELGKIASLLNQAKDEKTPLEHSLDNFSKKLALFIIAICLLVFALSIYRKVTFIDSLMFAVALAVAAIPEALCAIVTIVLALGTQKMASEKAIVKDLKAVESLGSINVICSDKTGTITQNKMSVKSIYFNGICNFDQLPDIYLECLALCNDSLINSNGIVTTDDAILNYLVEHKYNYLGLRNKFPRLSEITFDSKRKLMSVVCNANTLKMYTKGAAEVVLNKCSSLLVNDKIIPIDNYSKERINETIYSLASKGQRVLGISYKEINKSIINADDENDLVFLGLIGFIDPPKAEVKTAIASAKKAGIIPIMITGDHLQTAISISNEVGIDSIGIEGHEIDKLYDEELINQIEKFKIYARVTPENKIRIVNAWQAKGASVAFVGDGINDAPAIKKANVGISMGISGTEVSKDSASIVLLDDNYQTIINAVKNGRCIYNNIQNAICFLMSGNAAGIIAVAFTSLIGLPVPFAPVHLLFINLLTDSLPAIGIGMEEPSDSVMNKNPRKQNESIMNKRILIKTIIYGLLLSISTITAFLIGNKDNIYIARTMAFTSLCIGRLFHSFNCLTNFNIVKSRKLNKMFKLSLGLGILLILTAMFFRPLSSLLAVEPLNKTQIFVIFSCALIPTIIVQLFKAIKTLLK